MAHAHIVFAHPATAGFTREVLHAVERRLTALGCTTSISDLYAMGFRAEMSPEEYARESAYAVDRPVPGDVRAEQDALTEADMWVFVYPVWWADCPAVLKGWFDRVWTAGFAHHTATPVRASRALVVCTAGYPIEKLENDGLYQAMRATMLNDRIGVRAGESDFVLLTRDDDVDAALDAALPLPGTGDELLARLADAVEAAAAHPAPEASGAHPIRVAVDGPPAAGKTTLADSLAGVLRARGRHVIRATIDDFLHPPVRRYARGEFSAESCYFDAHDHQKLTRVLLDPLGPDGDRRYQTTHTRPVITAPAGAVLLFDGVFLLRPELIGRWDLRIFVSVELEKTVARAVDRESSSRAAVERRWRERYIPAQQLYFAKDQPTAHADIIVRNDNPEHPAWTIRQPAR